MAFGLDRLGPRTREHLDRLVTQMLAERKELGLRMPAMPVAIEPFISDAGHHGYFDKERGTIHFNVASYLSHDEFAAQFPSLSYFLGFVDGMELMNDDELTSAVFAENPLPHARRLHRRTQIQISNASLREGNLARTIASSASTSLPYLVKGGAYADAHRLISHLEEFFQSGLSGDESEIFDTLRHETDHAAFWGMPLDLRTKELYGKALLASHEQGRETVTYRTLATSLPDAELREYLKLRLLPEVGAFFFNIVRPGEWYKVGEDPQKAVSYIVQTLYDHPSYVADGIYEAMRRSTLRTMASLFAEAYAQDPSRLARAYEAHTLDEFTAIAKGKK